ncbi:MAG: hypothetical protein WB999_02385, partial [Candidatus Binataceae bacterium]
MVVVLQTNALLAPLHNNRRFSCSFRQSALVQWLPVLKRQVFDPAGGSPREWRMLAQAYLIFW